MPSQTEINTFGLPLEAKFAVEQGQKFFPITHRKAIMGLSVNTLTLSESLEIEVDEADNTITINPVVQDEINRIDERINDMQTSISEDISTSIDNLWDKVNNMNYAGSTSPGGPANSAMKLQSSFNLQLTGDAIGNADIDGSGNVTLRVSVAKTQNNYAGAEEDGGAANSAVRLDTPRNINITGSEIGSATFDGTEDLTINLSVNHEHSQYSLATHNHDDVYSKLGHTHNYAGSDSAGGVATSAAKLSNARTITIAGSVKADAVSFDGSKNITINTTTNHNHDGVYSKLTHNHDSTYLKLAGGTMTGNLHNNARYYQNGVLGCIVAVQSGTPSTGNVLWAY